ncbi:MAG: glutamate racemase [Cytophagaceae bacterium]|nr:glutamate racemase [Cytophagaceae bacterium]MDW8455879.1 glutamate racemase [Cytophagaceae bacterium]
MDQNAPIGIFDSGIGGLTVARAVHELLPKENFIYFGDTAHLPYGDKSVAAIQSYTIKICDILLKQQCKLILIACNSASSAAYELAREYVGRRAKVLNVIDPVVAYIGQHYSDKTIGLIGTKRTISSNVYRKKIDKLNKNIRLQCLATPLLAPMIEEGYFNNSISQVIITDYLSSPELQQIEALILGCTHYPLIQPQIEKFYDYKVEILNTASIVAEEVKQTLATENMLNPNSMLPYKKFFVSDYTQSFAESAKIFFGATVQLEHYPLWE